MSARPGSRLIVVLGASGFIGSAVASRLAAREERVRLVARRPVPVPGASAAIERLECDLTQPDAVARAVAGADVVLPMTMFAGNGSWRVDEQTMNTAAAVNVGIIGELVERFRSAGTCPTVVYPGSTSQAGPVPGGVVDGSQPDEPATPYDRQKLAAEHAIIAASEAGVIRGLALRLPTVFGPPVHAGAADRGVVTAMARRALSGSPLTVWNGGTARRDLLYIDDVVRAFDAAIEHAERLAGRSWPIGSGRPMNVHSIFTEIAEVAAAANRLTPVPVVSIPAPDYASTMDLHDVVVNPEGFRRVTGWSADVAPREGIERTVSGLLREEYGGSDAHP